MKVYKFNKRDTRFAPWTALCVLSLIAAMVFVVPSMVFAQITYELSQDCETALVGTEHTITAKVTDGDVPVVGAALMFMVSGVNPGYHAGIMTGQDGTAALMYTGANTGDDTIMLLAGSAATTIKTTWTANEADLCPEPKSPGITVGGRMTLNVKKKGALKIAVCAVDGLDVDNVILDSVYLAGVAPWHSKQKDSRLCPGGKNGVKDLVLKFKNREVVEALEKDLGKELVDGDKDVSLVLTGELKDGTLIEGTWKAEIKKKGKRHGKNKHHQGYKNGKGKGPK